MATNKECRTYTELRTSYLRENICQLKSYLDENIKFMAVVKGNAYGHGIEPCVQVMDDLCDWYGTATVTEALRVRNVSIKPILVFGYTSDEEILEAARKKITLSATSIESMQHISAICERNKLAIDVHIKLDTGFHRMGIDCWKSVKSCVEQVKSLYALPYVKITGMYTHLVFAGSMQEGEQAFTHLQYERFTTFITELRAYDLDPGLCHICNSKATVHEPAMHMDMVRVGAYIYGLASLKEREEIPLREVLSWKARIVHIRRIKEKEGVGYGHDFIAERETKVAVISVGFADGYRRCISLSSDACVFVCGKKVPIIGKICMDMLMVDVTDIEEIKTGDIATLCGQEGNDAVSAYTLGKIIQGTAGEITVGITDRVERRII